MPSEKRPERYEAEQDSTYPHGWRVKGGAMAYNPRNGDKLERDKDGTVWIVVTKLFSEV